MDELIGTLTDWGYAGLFVGAILAGSVLPFNSESVMAALYVAGLDPWALINYFIGRMGKMEWIERYLKVKRDKLERARRWVAKYGAWMGLLAWIPLLGSAITVALGLMRSNIPLTFTAIFIGKLTRYVLVIYGTSLFM